MGSRSIAFGGFVVLMTLMTLPGPGWVQAAQGPEWVVPRATPAIYTILNFADFTVSYPRQVQVDVKKIDQQFKQYQSAGGKLDRAAFACQKVIDNPSEYLTAVAEKSSLELKNRPFASGTGFVVSREGILLTNAHVVGDPHAQELLDDPMSAVAVFEEPLNQLVSALRSDLGQLPENMEAPTILALGQWMARHGEVEGKFNHAELVLKFKSAASLTLDKDGHVKIVRNDLLTVPLEVLVRGEEFPGKDVAVVKADLDAGLKRLTREDRTWTAQEKQRLIDQIQNDRLICLPLGHSFDVHPGQRVEAMGYPGIGFDQSAMREQAKYAVDAQDGQIAQSRQLTTGWDAFEITANINHGDSGGPVLDESGTVIGINVAVSAQGPSHNLAVPIDVAWEFLRKSGITPDPGPLTKHWSKGIELFADGRYAEARAEFETCRQMQLHSTGGSAGMLAANLAGNPVLNPAVEEYILRCQIKQGEVKLPK